MTALTKSDDPDRASIPFDKERSGFVMGEGAGILILEELEHAKARGAKIYAEIVGYGATGDAYHITSPDPGAGAAAKCLEFAVQDAGLQMTDIDYINAHGTSTPLNERVETSAIKQAFGDHASKLMVSSTKSMTGHMLGAAGAVEGIVTALALRDGIVLQLLGIRFQMRIVTWIVFQIRLAKQISIMRCPTLWGLADNATICFKNMKIKEGVLHGKLYI